MNINWTAFLKDSLEPPKTVDDAVDLHFSLGTDIRNSFSLHDKNSPLLKSLGLFVHPDDASMLVINALWKKLRDYE